MENIKQKIVLPTRGVCNTTPDPICEDNEMEDCVGLTYADDAIRPIQDVAKQIEVEGTLMFVHRLNDGQTVNYVTAEGDTLMWGDEDSIEIGYTIRSVESVGNTLIVNTDGGLYYMLWYNGSYKNLGNKIAEPDIRFRMYALPTDTGSSPNTYNVTNITERDLFEISGDWGLKIKEGNMAAFYDSLAAAYAENKKALSRKEGFSAPFFVCYALELYDGTYVMASNPILMLPTIKRGTFYYHIKNSVYGESLVCMTNYAKLQYYILHDFSLWQDIVKNVSVFVSREIEQFDLNPTFDNEKEKTFLPDTLDFNGITTTDNRGPLYYSYTRNFVSTELRRTYNFYDLRPEDEVKRDVVETSVFYKIAEINSAETDTMYATWENVPIKSKTTLENLETQDRLEPLEYFSHCSFSVGGMKTFNRRLNIINIRRSFFKGFNSFMPIMSADAPSYNHYPFHYNVDVTIKINGTENHVIRDLHTYDVFFEDMWFYYPDPRASHVKIKNKAGNTILDADLKEHKGLNGAYYFNDLPSSSPSENAVCPYEDESVSLPEPEFLDNYLIQSDVDNPFTFTAKGYVRVGQGRILGMAGLTTALSQDAYKVSTTIVFTTQGIWALEIDSEGVYKTVPPPFSREVCSNPKSITMVDNGIYYVSKRGLMVISDNANGCVTTQICGKNHKEYDSFTEFIQNCTCAYDYRDSQLWLINPDYDFHWVYSIKSGTLSRKEDGHSYEAVVSDYPDTLLQAEGSIFSMYQEPNINDDETLYSGFFITRPMKFEQAMALKSLRDLKHIKDMNADAEITLTILASNDCASWQQLSSLKGRGFKYFKFRYDLTNLKAADAFCGTVLYYTTRLTDRIR